MTYKSFLTITCNKRITIYKAYDVTIFDSSLIIQNSYAL